MTWLRVLASRVSGVFGKSRLDRNLDAEIQSHIEMAIDENISRGMSPEDARREALRAFGGVENAKEAYRDRRGLPLIETFVQDVRFSLRALARRPAFTAVAVLTLALGIGANTAIFSVVNTLVLSPPNVTGADQVAVIWETGKEKREKGFFSYLTLQDIRAANHSFASIAAYKQGAAVLFDGEQAERVPGMRVTANFLQLVGVNPASGRDFLPDEEKRGAAPVVIVGYRFWQDRLGGSDGAIGSQLTLNGKAHTIVGVLPPDFAFPFGPKKLDILTTISGEGGNLDERGAQVLKLIGRLAPGASFAGAQAELEGIAGVLTHQYPNYNTDVGFYLVPVGEEIVGFDVRRALWMLLGAVGFLLLIACTNVTNLLLMRAGVRQRELAMRSALGAGAWRIARTVLTESMVIASLAFGVGLLIAFWGLSVIQSYGADQLPRIEEVHIDGWVLAFTAGVTVLTALLVGLLPVIKASRTDVNALLKAGSKGSTGAGSMRRWREVLVVAEVALGLVLLVGAGLMVRSFDSLVRVDPGFDPENVLSGQVSMTRPVYEEHDERVRYVDQTLERLGALPGVQSAAFVAPMPFSGGSVSGDFRIQGHPQPAPGQEPSASVCSVTPEYFQAIRIPLKRGRSFTDGDRRGGVGAAIVNEALVASYFTGEDPIGMVITNVGANQNEGDPERWEIVGVVADVRHNSLTKDATPEIYFPYQQNSWDWGNFFVRTSNDPAASAKAFADAIREGDKAVPVMDVMPLSQAISKTVAESRFYTLLFSLFGVAGLLLTLTGVYSVVSYGVSQQTQEIGIRMALGAQARDILRLVFRTGMIPTLTGVALGLVGAIVVTRLMQTLLFGISTDDPATFVVVVVVMVLAALGACYVPARRAATVDPLVALRYE